MPVLRLKRFSQPETIRSMDQAALVAFLGPHRSYFAHHDIDLDATIDHEALVRLLLEPGEDVPDALVEALFLVHECCSEEVADDLLGRVELAALEVPPHATALDIAIAVWLARPDVVRSQHAEGVAKRQQSFFYYGGSSPVRDPAPPPTAPDLLREVEADLDAWFSTHQRGRGCQVLTFQGGNKTWFTIRHGHRKVREPSQADDGRSSTEFFRPQKYDVLLYDRVDDCLAVHAGSKREIDLYLKSFGRHLFGRADYFTQGDIFTLAPLVDDGMQSMSCADIEGLDAIRLVEVTRAWSGVHQEMEIRKATNLFAALASRGVTLSHGRLVSAVMKVSFEGSNKERTVTIRTPASARYERNEDSELIGQWLAKRGFVKRRRTDAVPAPVLEVA